jgi:hypothetical protein
MNRIALLILCAVTGIPISRADDSAAMAILQAGCTQEAQRLCSGVQPGGGRVIACLQQHKDALSDQCKQAAQKAIAMSGGNAASAPSSAAAPGPFAAADAGLLGSSPSTDATASSAPPSAAGAPSSAGLSPKASNKSSASASKHATATADTSGSYLRLKKVHIMLIMSTQPNAQPKPEVEMLIPATWNFEGGLIPWQNVKTGCFADAYPLTMDAHSPDGTQGFQKIAEYSWQYSNDPQELQRLTAPDRRMRSGNGKVCEVAKPSTAEQYFREKIMPILPKDTKLISIEPYPELNEIVRQQMALGPQDNPNGLRIDSIRAHIEFDGTGKNNKAIEGKQMEGWLTTAVVTRTYPVGRGVLYDMHAVDMMSLTTPKGQLAGNEKLFRVMMSSIRLMPEYVEFINKAIADLYQIQAKKEAGIDHINGDLQNFMMQTYQHISENSARVSQQGFLAADQNLRGVQTFRNPSTGQTMELSSQYDHAWLNGNDQYVMSDDPNFNPNAQLSGNWNQLQAVPPSP